MTLKYQVEDGVERKKNLRPEMNQRDDSVQYGHSDVFIRHDPAEIRGLVVVAPSHSQDFPFF